MAHTILEKCMGATNIADLDTAVYLFRQSVYLWSREKAPDRSEISKCLDGLATAFLTRARHTGRLGDIHRACSCRLWATGNIDFKGSERTVLELSEFDEMEVEENYGDIATLAFELLHAFHSSFELQLLNNAVDLYRAALALQPDRTPRQCTSLQELSDGLIIRFYMIGNLQDLQEAVSLLRELCRLQPNRISCLCAALLIPEHEGAIDPSRLEEASQSLGDATSRDRTGLQFTESGMLSFQGFLRSGFPLYMTRAVTSFEQAESYLSWGHPGKSGVLGNLATALYYRFQHGRDATDLDKAIHYFREALGLYLPPETDRSALLSNLGSALSERYYETRNSEDLDSAIQRFREALALGGPTHPEHSTFLTNLANTSRERFQQGDDLADLDSAIELYHKALDRFEQNGKGSDDVDIAIALYEEALRLEPAERTLYLNNLANCYNLRFKRSGVEADFEKGLKLHEEALSLLPAPHPQRGELLENIAVYHTAKFEAMAPQSDRCMDHAALAFREASTYPHSSPSQRLGACLKWASYADRAKHDSALEAYHIAIELLPQVALSLDLLYYSRGLSSLKAGNLISDATACALRSNKLTEAVEFLESGRSIFWSHALQIINPLDDLRIVNPALAQKVSDTLLRNSSRDLPSTRRLPHQFEEHRLVESQAMRHAELNKEWLDAFEDAQKRTGSKGFLQPKPFTEIQKASINGPVVFVNASRSGFTALIMQTDNLQCVSLPDINMDSAALLVQLLRGSANSVLEISAFLSKYAHNKNSAEVSASEARLFMKLEDSHNFTATENDVLASILEELWTAVVHPVLNALNLTKVAIPPRLWWCPTGPLTFLPLHAAGVYRDQEYDCVSDYIISSYLPTTSPLLDPPKQTDSPCNVTVIIQPKTPSLPDLPGAAAELKVIEGRVPKKWVSSLGRTEPATVQTALPHLPVLFSLTARLKFKELIRARRNADGEKHMSLAYLSACETAKGHLQLPDEAMHLAATLLFAGFGGVVGTMTIDDRDGPTVAGAFYEHLFRTSDAESDPPVLPDLKEAAQALHMAVKELRKDPGVSFTRWVPFVHFGL
ncbi:hypothetical protein C8J57DRAFT_1543505 [Mycena rebaudengoi]|nr:hypothetical protein C8J57DRAFT_1543505 [Mycena rebaudengoi]